MVGAAAITECSGTEYILGISASIIEIVQALFVFMVNPETPAVDGKNAEAIVREISTVFNISVGLVVVQ